MHVERSLYSRPGPRLGRLLVPCLGVVALGLFSGGCIDGTGGAISVSWTIVDETTAATFPPPDNSNICSAVTSADSSNLHVFIEPQGMRLHVAPFVDDPDLGTSTGAELPCPSCSFDCNPPEHTTNFREIPAGTYRISLEATRCNLPVGVTPPAVVRAVRAGEVTNLHAIEILLPPNTDSESNCVDGGS